MKFNFLLLSLITTLLFTSCAKNKIQGLWVIDRIQDRSGEVKPKARWIEFDKGHYQESGSGWQKHGIGTWTIKKGEVTVLNSNGYINEFKPFKLKFTKDGMEWSRIEDDRKTKVFLTKIEAIPLSNRDKLLGVWDLKTALEDQQDKTLAVDPRNKAYIQIMWDNTFIMDRGPEGRISGIYRVDGNRNEIELVINEKECDIQTWNFEIDANRLVLMSVNQPKELIFEYTRIDHLPESD